MGDVASRDLRNDTRSVLRRVEEGEWVTITVGGRAVAELRPLSARPRWVGGRALAQRLEGHQADRELAGELRELAPDTTDDLTV